MSIFLSSLGTDFIQFFLNFSFQLLFPVFFR